VSVSVSVSVSVNVRAGEDERVLAIRQQRCWRMLPVRLKGSNPLNVRVQGLLEFKDTHRP